MNPRRSATVAALCGTIVLAGWIVAWLAAFGSAGIENTGAAPIKDRATSLAANAELADEPQATAMGNKPLSPTLMWRRRPNRRREWLPARRWPHMSLNRSSRPRCPIRRRCAADLPPVHVVTIETKSVEGHHDVALPVPTTRNASNPAPVTQDFQYLIYYVWSELSPAEKPAAIVLRSLKDTPVGTPVEEIKRASDAFGLDFNFMKAVAKIEFRFRPQATYRIVCRPVPTEQI